MFLRGEIEEMEVTCGKWETVVFVYEIMNNLDKENNDL